MTKTLQTVINQLPALLVRDAGAMMGRMVAAMQSAIAQDPQFANASYCALLLKLSEPDLRREFELALEEALKATETDPGKQDIFQPSTTLSLEPIDEAVTKLERDFAASTTCFQQVLAKAREQRVDGVGFFKKEVFLNALGDAFAKSRVDKAVITKLMPYAGRALNTTLLDLYRKLEAL